MLPMELAPPSLGSSTPRWIQSQVAVQADSSTLRFLPSHCATFLLVDIEYHLSCFDVHSSVTHKSKAVPNGKGKLCLDRPRISSLMANKTFLHTGALPSEV